MDNSWLLEENSSSHDSESDEEEKQRELESRLYSVIHHNDLSQPLPSSLAEQFSVECSDSGEVVVSLKKPLDDLLTNAGVTKKGLNLGVNNLDDSDVFAVRESSPSEINQKESGPDTHRSVFETPVLRRKRFRYSDINIDEVNKYNGSLNNSLNEGKGNNVKINYFKSFKLSKREKRRFGKIKLPTNTTLPGLDWKSDSNSHFISVNDNDDPWLQINLNVIRAMTDVLQNENPDVGKWRLKDYAMLLYRNNANIYKEKNGVMNIINSRKNGHNCNKNVLNVTQPPKNTSLNKCPGGKMTENHTSNEADFIKLNHSSLSDPITNGITAYTMEKCQVIEIEDDEVLVETPKNSSKSEERKEDVKTKCGKEKDGIISYTMEKSQVIEIEDDKVFVETPKTSKRCEERKEADVKKKCGKEKDGRTPNFGGSISLNISPFKPIVDLSSDDEDSKMKTPKTPQSYKASRDSLPQKWTKDMVKFYTTPSKRKLNQSIDQIHEQLKEESRPEDWKLHYQDSIGMYQSSNIWTKKCPKCGHRGHNPKTCEHKDKCYLCAGLGHFAHNCPNVPCITCGVNGRMLGMDQVCRNCYMLYMRNESCRICLGHDHHTAVCPDTWRSYHATVEGEKKIPEQAQENPRKWCCNCARKGHFSHQCPYPSYSKQPSPFVVNYLDCSSAGGSVDITLPAECYEIINDRQADEFLQSLSNRTGAHMEYGEEDRQSTIRVSGTFEQCNFIKREIEQYVNTKKRTIRQPTFKNKRRKFR